MKTIVVTVGSTKFDDLIEKIDSEEFINEAKKQGFGKIIAQIGAYKNEIKNLENYQNYMKPKEMKEAFANADLVIGHGGAGTIMEVLQLGKPLIIVVNDKLMENHQTELADKMEEEDLIIKTTTSNLIDTFKKGNFVPKKLTMDSSIFVDKIDKFLGFI